MNPAQQSTLKGELEVIKAQELELAERIAENVVEILEA